MNPNSFFKTVGVALLITGNLIGAGILALPINTGLAGVLPSLIGMMIAGGAMFASALILSKEAVLEKSEFFNYPSLYHTHLGSIGKWVAIVANLIILYGLLTAYLTGATAIIVNLLGLHAHKTLVLVLFFLVITTLNVTEVSLIRKYNVFLMILLFISFAVLIFMTESHIEVSRFHYTDWGFLPATIPIIITAFHFHNIIPIVCHNLEWKMSTIWKVILVGMLIGYLMNFLWTVVVAGAVPIADGTNSILYAFKNNLPSTVPLSNLIKDPAFITVSMIFAMLAIVTSYIMNGMGLLHFFHDLTINHFNLKNRYVSIALTFVPPFFISLIYPDIFLKALNIVGGIGIVLLFGILPSALLIKQSSKTWVKFLGFLLLILFAGFFIFEVMQETGLLKLKPSIEYWRHNVR